jgi:hypothetical protein
VDTLELARAAGRIRPINDAATEGPMVRATRRAAAGVVLVVLGLALAAPGVTSWAQEALAVDSCLDAGGSFDYVTETCDHERSHAVVPFGPRHARQIHFAILGASLVAVGAVVGLWAKGRGCGAQDTGR